MHLSTIGCLDKTRLRVVHEHKMLISYFNLPGMIDNRLINVFLLVFRKNILHIFYLLFCAFHPCSTTVICSFPVAGSEILGLAQRKINQLPPATV